MEDIELTAIQPKKEDYLRSLLQGDPGPLEAAAARWHEEAQTKASELFVTQNYVAGTGRGEATKAVALLEAFIDANSEETLIKLLTFVENTNQPETIQQKDYTPESFRKAVKNLKSLTEGNPSKLNPTAVVKQLDFMLFLIEKNDPENPIIIEPAKLLFDISDKMRCCETNLLLDTLQTILENDPTLNTTQVPLIAEDDSNRCHDAVFKWYPEDSSLVELCAPVQSMLRDNILPSIQQQQQQQQQQQLLTYKTHINEQLNSLPKKLSTLARKDANKIKAVNQCLAKMKTCVETYLNQDNPNVNLFKTESEKILRSTAKQLKGFTHIKNTIGKLTAYILSFGIVAGIDKLVEAKTGFSIFSINSSTTKSLKDIQKAIHEPFKPSQFRP